MNVLKALIVIAVISIGRGYAGECRDIGFLTVRSVRLAQEELRLVGLKGFMESAWSRGVSAPGIHSKYYVDRFTRGKPDLAALETAYRDFGLELLRQFDSLAVEVYRKPSKREELDRVGWMLRLAEWIRSPGKYENYRIAMRIEEAATMPLLRVITDMEIPEDTIVRLLDGFTTSDKSAPVRAGILYEESNGAFDLRGLLKGKKSTVDVFVEPWVWARRKAYWHFGFRLPEYSKESGLLLGESDKNAIVADDDVSGLCRDADRWDKKMHKIICVNSGSPMYLAALKKVFRFRQLIGGFPEIPVPPGVRERDAYDKEYGHRYRWQLTDEQISPEIVAAYYLDSRNNTYVDRQTQAMLDFQEINDMIRRNNKKAR